MTDNQTGSTGRAPAESMESFFGVNGGQAPVVSTNGAVPPATPVAAETAAPVVGVDALQKVILNNPEQEVEFGGRTIKVKDLEGEIMLREKYNKEVNEIRSKEAEIEAVKKKAEEAESWLRLIADDPVLATGAQMLRSGTPKDQIYRTIAAQTGMATTNAAVTQQEPTPPRHPDGTLSEPGDPIYDAWLLERKMHDTYGKKIADLESNLEKAVSVLSKQAEETEAERKLRESRQRVLTHNSNLIKEKTPAYLKEQFGESFDVAKLSDQDQRALYREIDRIGRDEGMELLSDDYLSREILKERDLKLVIKSLPQNLFQQKPSVAASAPVLGAAQSNGKPPLGAGGPSAGGIGGGGQTTLPERAPTAVEQLDNWFSQQPANK